jgi:NDP-sugar pyrophosphorylase family protein
MKAVVLVGGEGTRLRPLTETIPKPLLPFMNRPFLDHVLDRLADHGVEEVVCSSPYLESGFHDFLEGRSGRPPAVRWITEARPLGTAGAIAGARDHLAETFLALNGDVLADLDLGELIGFHHERGAVATIALHAVEDARPFGLVDADRTGRVLTFREKPEHPVPGAINAGIYVLEPAALDHVPLGEPVSIERQTYPRMIAKGEGVFGFVARGYWRDLGTPQAYLEGHLDALQGRIDAYRGVNRPLVASSAEIDPSADVRSLAVLGDGVQVGPGARVDRSVLHGAATVGKGALVEDSIMGPGSVVETGAEVRGAVLAEQARVPAGLCLEDERVAPGQIAVTGTAGGRGA